MRILRQKRGPPKPTDWRRLALATGLRYATPVGQGKTKNKQHTPDSQESISSNRLATFCSASLAPYSAPFTPKPEEPVIEQAEENAEPAGTSR